MPQDSAQPKSSAPKPSRTKKQEQMLKQPPVTSPQDQSHSSRNLPPLDFEAIQQRVFSVRGTDIYIGNKKVEDSMRSLLRDQAKGIITSQLWEVFNAAIINESADLALIQSENWDHIQFAKALHHWGHAFRNALYHLARD